MIVTSRCTYITIPEEKRKISLSYMQNSFIDQLGQHFYHNEFTDSIEKHNESLKEKYLASARNEKYRKENI